MSLMARFAIVTAIVDHRLSSTGHAILPMLDRRATFGMNRSRFQATTDKCGLAAALAHMTRHELERTVVPRWDRTAMAQWISFGCRLIRLIVTRLCHASVGLGGELEVPGG
jgi:hypothetical protein